MFMINRSFEDSEDELIIAQMKASEYPENIYEELLEHLSNMKGCTLSCMRKKLKYLEGIVINKSFVTNQVIVPDIFRNLPEKQVSIEHIVAISNILRIMKEDELNNAAIKLLKLNEDNSKSLNFMMAYLLAAGSR